MSTLFGVCALALVFAGMSQAAQTSKAPASHAKITGAQAEAVALHKYPGKIVDKTKLENEEGVWQYGVMVRSGKTLREIMVNAKTGKIDNVEVTTAAKEGIEAQADAAKEKPAHKAGKGAKCKTSGKTK